MIEPLDQEYIPKKATEYQTLIKLIKMTVGSGIFAFPYAYLKIGLYFGVILQILVNMFYFMDSLDQQQKFVNSCHKPTSISEWIDKHYGSKSYLALFVNISSVVLIYGCVVSYFIVFINTICTALDADNTNAKLFIGLCLFILHYFNQFNEKMDKLIPIMTLSVYLVYLSLFYFIALAFYIDEWNAITMDPPKMMIAFGIMMFSYDCNGSISEIRQEMKNQSKFESILLASMLIETILYVAFGIMCALTFGENTEGLILENFQNVQSNQLISSFTSTIIIVYSSTLVVNSLGMNIPGFRIIKLQFDLKEEYQSIPTFTFFIFFELITAILFPNFALVLSLLGCMATVSLGFVFPFILSVTIKNDRYKIENYAILFFGIFGGVAGLISCF
ncbi:hypothetical protein pb186bvf_001326 [Paramecium bursaria]